MKRYDPLGLVLYYSCLFFGTWCTVYGVKHDEWPLTGLGAILIVGSYYVFVLGRSQ